MIKIYNRYYELEDLIQTGGGGGTGNPPPITTNRYMQGGNSFSTTAILGTLDAYDLAIITDATERIRLTKNGLIGVGTTIPEYAVDIRTSDTAYLGIAVGVNIQQDLIATDHDNRLIALKIEPTYNVGSYLGVEKWGLYQVGVDIINKIEGRLLLSVDPVDDLEAVTKQYVDAQSVLAQQFNGNRTVTRQGIPLINVGGTSLIEFINNYFFPSVPATLTMGSFSIQEKGTTYIPTITGLITPNDATITARRIKKDGVVVNNPSGNTISYIASGITVNTTFTIEVDSTINSVSQSMLTLSRTISFYAPIYYGVGAVGLNETQIKSLTKVISSVRVQNNLNFNPSNQRYYFVYPASFGVLTSIIDQNGFNITSAFNQSTSTFTLADGVTQESYYIYVSNSNTTQTNFKISFN